MLHWILIGLGLTFIAINIYRLVAGGGIAVNGFYPIVYIIGGAVLAYFGWTMRPVAPPAVAAPMTAGRRRRGGRW